MEVGIIIPILQLLLLAYLCTRITSGLNVLSFTCLGFFTERAWILSSQTQSLSVKKIL